MLNISGFEGSRDQGFKDTSDMLYISYGSVCDLETFDPEYGDIQKDDKRYRSNGKIVYVFKR